MVIISRLLLPLVLLLVVAHTIIIDAQLQPQLMREASMELDEGLQMYESQHHQLHRFARRQTPSSSRRSRTTRTRTRTRMRSRSRKATPSMGNASPEQCAKQLSKRKFKYPYDPTPMATALRKTVLNDLQRWALYGDLAYCKQKNDPKGKKNPLWDAKTRHLCVKGCTAPCGFDIAKGLPTGGLNGGYIAPMHDPRKNLLGFVARNDNYKEIFITFRGTEREEQTNDVSFYKSLFTAINNIVTDANARGVRAADVLKPFEKLPKGAYIHSGFLYAYMALRQQVFRDLKPMLAKYPKYKLVVVGHSLGGAIATVCAYDLIQAMPEVLSKHKMQLATFGSPRVGNYLFVDTLSKRLPSISDYESQWFRVVCERDPIPHLPCAKGVSKLCGKTGLDVAKEFARAAVKKTTGIILTKPKFTWVHGGREVWVAKQMDAAKFCRTNALRSDEQEDETCSGLLLDPFFIGDHSHYFCR